MRVEITSDMRTGSDLIVKHNRRTIFRSNDVIYVRAPVLTAARVLREFRSGYRPVVKGEILEGLVIASGDDGTPLVREVRRAGLDARTGNWFIGAPWDRSSLPSRIELVRLRPRYDGMEVLIIA